MKTKFFYDYKTFRDGVLIQYGRREVTRDWLMVNTYHGKTTPQKAFDLLLDKWNFHGSRPNILGITHEYAATEETETFWTNTPENSLNQYVH